MSGKDTPVRAQYFDFRRAILRDLLFADPLTPTSAHAVGLASAAFLLAAGVLEYATDPFVLFLAGGYSLGYSFYLIWWFYQLITTATEAKKATKWFQIADPVMLRRQYYNKRPALTGLEAQFADVVHGNRIDRLQVNDGRLRTHGKVKINVDWRAGDVGNSTLYLYSDIGDMQDDVTTFRTRSSARRLDVKTAGQPIRYVQTEVTKDKNYNYYAWIEIDFYGRLILSVNNYGHWTQPIETPSEYAARVCEAHNAKKEVDEIRNPAKPTPEPSRRDKARAEAIKMAESKKTRKEEEEEIQKIFDENDLDEYEREEIREAYLRDGYQ